MTSAVLSFSGISKSFGGFEALHDVSFELPAGEIVGLVGANGAGKSTLLKIVAGVHPASSGRMLLNGTEYRPSSPQHAKSSGIASVFQELNLFLAMSVAENIFIDDGFRNRWGLIDWKRMTAEAGKVLASCGLDIPPAKLVGELGIAQQQMVEIVRALGEKPDILLLDEPTACLSEDQTRWLFEKVREAVAGGTSVLYVSHRLDEVTELCDRCVILRDGGMAATLEKSEIRKDRIIRHMVGREIPVAGRGACGPGGDSGVVFECVDLSVKGKLDGISFQVHCGEILGIAGLVGAGRTELLNTIYGILRPTRGTVKRDGVELVVKHPRVAIAHGIAPVSEDRKTEGSVLRRDRDLQPERQHRRQPAAPGFHRPEEGTGPGGRDRRQDRARRPAPGRPRGPPERRQPAEGRLRPRPADGRRPAAARRADPRRRRRRPRGHLRRDPWRRRAGARG